METRLTALELGYEQLKRDLSDVAISQKELYNQQTILDKTMNSVLIKIDEKLSQEQGLEDTIKATNNTVNSINLKLAASPMERHNEVQTIVDPLFKNLRDQEKKFTECGDGIKNTLRKEAKSHIGIIWGALVIIAVLGLYIINTASTTIIDGQQENKELIMEHLNDAKQEVQKTRIHM